MAYNSTQEMYDAEIPLAAAFNENGLDESLMRDWLAKREPEYINGLRADVVGNSIRGGFTKARDRGICWDSPKASPRVNGPLWFVGTPQEDMVFFRHEFAAAQPAGTEDRFGGC